MDYGFTSDESLMAFTRVPEIILGKTDAERRAVSRFGIVSTGDGRLLIETGRRLEGAYSIALSPRGRFLATGHSKTIRLWRLVWRAKKSATTRAADRGTPAVKPTSGG